MRFWRLEPLSAKAEELLAAERHVLPAPPEIRTRAMARARAVLDVQVAPVARMAWRTRVSAPLAAALVLGVAALSLAAWQAHRAEEVPRPSESSAAAVAALTPSKAADPIPDTGTTTAPAPDVVPPVVAQKESRGPAPRRLSDADVYAAELGLLQHARASVAAGRFSAALDSVSEHERRFPAGRLREERDALRVKALAGLGRGDDASAAAERFRARYPRSVLSTGIEAATRRGP
jgi:hypothetical protein